MCTLGLAGVSCPKHPPCIRWHKHSSCMAQQLVHALLTPTVAQEVQEAYHDSGRNVGPSACTQFMSPAHRVLGCLLAFSKDSPCTHASDWLASISTQRQTVNKVQPVQATFTDGTYAQLTCLQQCKKHHDQKEAHSRCMYLAHGN